MLQFDLTADLERRGGAAWPHRIADAARLLGSTEGLEWIKGIGAEVAEAIGLQATGAVRLVTLGRGPAHTWQAGGPVLVIFPETAPDGALVVERGRVAHRRGWAVLVRSGEIDVEPVDVATGRVLAVIDLREAA